MKLHKSGSFENDMVIDIGMEIERLISTANRATQDFIMVFCVSSIANLIIACFHIVAILWLSNSLKVSRKTALVTAFIFAVIMYLVRFYNLMKAGQRLGAKIKRSSRALGDVMIMNQDMLDEKTKNKLSVLRERLEVYRYRQPISPYSVFGLGTKTFCATLATVITYMVCLVKLRDLGSSKTLFDVGTLNQTNQP